MDLSALQAPTWLADQPRQEWIREPQSVNAGEVWLLSWDGQAKGLALVTAVRDTYALIAPITEHRASARELVVPAEALGRELCVWPRLETGVGAFLLHRRLARLLDAVGVSALRRWGFDEDVVPPLTAGTQESRSAALEEVIAETNALCFIEWPDHRDAVLNVDALGSTPSVFANRTGMSVPRVLQLWDSQPLTAEETVAIAEAFGLDPGEVTSLPADSLIAEMSEPRYKDLIVRIALAQGADESSTRREVRSRYALAARTDSATVRQSSRLKDTLKRMLSEVRDAAGS